MTQATAQLPTAPPTQENVDLQPRKRKEIEPSKMAVNFTSMIDVIFNLLIYFVITASFAVGEGVILAKLPAGTGAAAENKLPERPINIELTSHDVYEVRIRVEGASEAPTHFTGLIQLLESLQSDPGRGRNGPYKPDNPVIIRPDGQVRWQHVVNAFNACIKARYSNVSFATASGG